MQRKKLRAAGIARMPYAPPRGYSLDLEVVATADLLHRTPPGVLRMPHRLSFLAVIGVTEGYCRHIVDFTPCGCGAGAWLIVRPGQVLSYDVSSRWNGWQLVFRPEFLLPRPHASDSMDGAVAASLESMPLKIKLPAAEHRAAAAGAAQMSADAASDASPALRNALLRYQLYALVLRLLVGAQRQQPQPRPAPVQVARFDRFRRAVEQEFATTHRVAEYAKRIGCSEKNLTRAVLAVAAMPPKAYVSERIALEAKRLLAHTALPVAAIAAQLGFAEPTHFVKFFKREVEATPGEFRRRMRVV